VTLEWLARVFLIADQSGTPTLIDDEELKRVQLRLAEFAEAQRERLRRRN
jgi:hypothetical protein